MKQSDIVSLQNAIAELSAADEHMSRAEACEEHRTAVLRLRFKLNDLLAGLKNKLHWAEENAKREQVQS